MGHRNSFRKKMLVGLSKSPMNKQFTRFPQNVLNDVKNLPHQNVTLGSSTSLSKIAVEGVFRHTA